MDAHEKYDLKKLMSIEVPEDRIDRLSELVTFDSDEELSEEVKRYLIKQQIRYVNIQYARFLAGSKIKIEDIDELLVDAIDIHAHGGSEPFERIMLEDDLAIDYAKAKMRAVVIKTWFTPSASRNALVQKIVNKWAEENEMRPIQVIGGITLNKSVGGINPNAVERCLKYPNFKYVWMPMVDSVHHRKVVYDDQTGNGIHFLDENRKVMKEMKDILKIIADNDLILATGHYPYADSAILFEEAKRVGVNRMEFVHPAHIHSKCTIAQMKEAATEGVKLMLSGLGTLCFPIHENGPVYAARMISEIGAEHFVYGSDFGQIHNPPHIVGTRWMIQMLMAYGVTKDEITQIFKINPAIHLDLK
jgi:hypothetical protein